MRGNVVYAEINGLYFEMADAASNCSISMLKRAFSTLDHVKVDCDDRRSFRFGDSDRQSYFECRPHSTDNCCSSTCGEPGLRHDAKSEWLRAMVSIILTIGIFLVRQPDFPGNQHLLFDVAFELDCNANL